jgi:hypothetical protein
VPHDDRHRVDLFAHIDDRPNTPVMPSASLSIGSASKPALRASSAPSSAIRPA